MAAATEAAAERAAEAEASADAERSLLEADVTTLWRDLASSVGEASKASKQVRVRRGASGIGLGVQAMGTPKCHR